MRNKFFLLMIAVVAIMLMTSCGHTFDLTDCMPEKVYGFWGGLWHGMIAPFSFIAKLFNPEVAVHAANNNGAWYELGFLLGIGGSSGGAASARRKK